MLKDATQTRFRSSGPRLESARAEEAIGPLGGRRQTDALADCLRGIHTTIRGDVAVDCDHAISSSGNSVNIVRAAEFAVSRNATVVTLSAMQPTNALRRLGTLNSWLPAASYGLAETGHAAILHYWMDQVSLER